jgi:hypothetical protein
MNNQKYDWIVVGGGIAGISLAEILCREGKSVLLIEKNDKIASETTKVFHEWLHTGALYSLLPDNLVTMRYLLGAIDDLFEYYSSYPNMNLLPTESGVSVSGKNKWFNNNFIEYRYKIRKLNPVWLSLVSRSINVVQIIKQHDWLRRNAGGSEYESSKIKSRHSFNLIKEQLLHNENFYRLMSSDFTMNSRILINDLFDSASHYGLNIIKSEPVMRIDKTGSFVKVETSCESYKSDKVVICSPDVISAKYKIPIKTSFAPMFIVDDIPENETSFVELDYNTKRCINLLKKGNGVGQAGGSTVKNDRDVKPYLNYMIKEHKKRNPGIKVLDNYVGLKKELVKDKEQRNYLYHINQHDSDIWSVVLGKFTLAFSLAPEFYRRVYHENPKKVIDNNIVKTDTCLISKTSWQEIIENKRN